MTSVNSAFVVAIRTLCQHGKMTWEAAYPGAISALWKSRATGRSYRLMVEWHKSGLRVRTAPSREARWEDSRHMVVAEGKMSSALVRRLVSGLKRL